MYLKKNLPYSKRERRTAIHIANFTPSGLEKLTEVAEASGVSRNEAVIQACENWVAEREEMAENKVRCTFPIDARQLKRLTKLARKTKTSVGAILAELVHAKLVEASKKKTAPKGGANASE